MQYMNDINLKLKEKKMNLEVSVEQIIERKLFIKIHKHKWICTNCNYEVALTTCKPPDFLRGKHENCRNHQW